MPVDDDSLKKIAELSGGTAYTASSLQQLKEVYSTLQDQIGFETIRGEAAWTTKAETRCTAWKNS